MIMIKNTKITKSKSAYKHQVGLSLVELMISVTLGFFLIAGVATTFIGTKNNEKTRSAISEMDATARAALGTLRQTILHAGYPSIYNIELDKPFYTPSDGELTNPNCRGGSIKRDLYTVPWNLRTRDSGRTDFLTVISMADNPCKAGLATCAGNLNANANVNPKALVYYDCVGGGADRTTSRVTACSAEPGVGMENPRDAKIYSSFWVDRYRTLSCRGSRGNTQPIVDNIEYMQFLYGVKREDGSISYRGADLVERDGQWEQVSSIQIAILVRSSKDVLKKASEKEWYILLDTRKQVTDLHRLFRVYTTTVNLENKNEGALL